AKGLAEIVGSPGSHDWHGNKSHAENSDCEQKLGEFSCQWTERLCGVGGSVDVDLAGPEQSGSGRENNEVHYKAGKEHAKSNIMGGMAELGFCGPHAINQPASAHSATLFHFLVRLPGIQICRE